MAASAVVWVVEPDHVVIRTSDPVASVEWWARITGLEPLRVDEFKAGKAPFPSVRVSSSFIIDFAGKEMAQLVGGGAKAGASQGIDEGAATADAPRAIATPASGQLDHVCLALQDDLDMEEVARKLEAAGVPPQPQFDGGTVVRRFGARGVALSVYVRTPEGVTLELRSYPTRQQAS